MRKWYPAVIIIGAITFSIAVYHRLPAAMATHWSHGQADKWSDRSFGAFVIPFHMVLVWAVMRALPKIDPRAANYAKFPETYDLVINLAQTALAAVHVVLLGSALGWALPVDRIGPAITGVVLVVIGNVLPRSRPNWWFGIRTPWTLSSDSVWARTHRVAGYLLIAGGLACISTIALPSSWTKAVVLTAAFGAVVGSIAYSAVVWREERRG